MPRPSTMFSMQSLNGGTVINIPNPDKASGSNLIAALVVMLMQLSWRKKLAEIRTRQRCNGITCLKMFGNR